MLVFIRLMRRVLGPIEDCFSKVTDGRVASRIKYPIGACIFSALLMMAANLKRRSSNALLRNRMVCRLFKRLFGVGKVVHGDAVADAFEQSDPRAFEALREKTVNRLIRDKVFDTYRLLGMFVVIAIDGTQTLSWKRRHCPHCLTRKHEDGSTTYHHFTLEASIVGRNGAMFPIMTEPIENREPGQAPQDCELAAFHRLAERLYAAWPRLRVILTLDALYANGPVFNACKRYGWHFIVTMKNATLPCSYTEFQCRLPLHRDQKIVRSRDDGGTETYVWVNDIHHTGVDGRSHRIHVLECTVRNRAGRITRRFRWVTSHPISAETVEAIANHGGRIRWNTEEGFKILKVDGFNLEHIYSHDPIAAKIYHHLLLLAMLLMQILHKSTLGQVVVESTANARQITFDMLSRLVLEALRTCGLDDEGWKIVGGGTLQIRFVDDT